MSGITLQFPIQETDKVQKGDNKTQTDSTQKKNDDEKESGKQEVQRVPTNAFDSYKNKVSNIEIYSTNYGILGQNVAATSNADKVGGFWGLETLKMLTFLEVVCGLVLKKG